MSKEGKKDKFFCIAGCLPVKGKTAKNQKAGNRPLKDENVDPDIESLLPEDTCTEEARKKLTLDWVRDNTSTMANIDQNSRLRDQKQPKTKGDDKSKKLKNSSENRSGSLNDDSTMKPTLDSSVSTADTKQARKVDEAEDSMMTSVSRRHYRRPRRSGRTFHDHRNDADGVSMASSCVSLATETISIKIDGSKSLGITIVGHFDTQKVDCGIFIGCVKKGGAAEECGRVEPGDLILEVNNIDLENLPNEKALGILKREMAKSGVLTLTLAKYWDMDDDRAVETQLTDAYDVGSVQGQGSRENTLARKVLPRGHPMEEGQRRRRFEESFEAHSSRFDVMSRPQSALMYQNQYYQQGGYPGRPYPPMPPVYMDYGYHDPRKHVYPPYVPQPPSTRVPVRRSMLGSELVSWIQETVPSMSARNEARNYAQLLLDNGYLSGTERRFHEDGWYAFLSNRPLPPPPSYY